MLRFLENIFRAGQVWHAETLATLQLNTVEFLQEETRDLPATAETELFYAQIKQLNDNALALAEKLNQLTDQTTQGKLT